MSELRQGLERLSNNWRELALHCGMANKDSIRHKASTYNACAEDIERLLTLPAPDVDAVAEELLSEVFRDSAETRYTRSNTDLITDLRPLFNRVLRRHYGKEDNKA